MKKLCHEFNKFMCAYGVLRFFKKDVLVSIFTLIMSSLSKLRFFSNFGPLCHVVVLEAPIQIQIWLGVQKVNCSCTILVPVYKLLQQFGL